MWSLGMSSDMRPSERRWSSDTARRSAGPGERWWGVAGAAGGLFALRRFSNWARREETGFCGRRQWCEHLQGWVGRHTMDEASLPSAASAGLR